MMTILALIIILKMTMPLLQEVFVVLAIGLACDALLIAMAGYVIYTM